MSNQLLGSDVSELQGNCHLERDFARKFEHSHDGLLPVHHLRLLLLLPPSLLHGQVQVSTTHVSSLRRLPGRKQRLEQSDLLLRWHRRDLLLHERWRVLWRLRVWWLWRGLRWLWRLLWRWLIFTNPDAQFSFYKTVSFPCVPVTLDSSSHSSFPHLLHYNFILFYF